ncbi:MAG: transposase [Candidatus Altimarinota bacterium]
MLQHIETKRGQGGVGTRVGKKLNFIIMEISKPEKFRNRYRIDSARLKYWDYSTDGGYFITIITQNREHFFGEIVDGEMKLSEMGLLIKKFWHEIPNYFEHAILDEFVIMPNHIHGIIILCRMNEPSPCRDAINRVSTAMGAGKTGGITKNHNPMLHPHSLSKIIRWFKGRTTFEIRKQNNTDFAWQPRFHDRVIRNEYELNRIRKYIFDNPSNWEMDRNNLDDAGGRRMTQDDAGGRRMTQDDAGGRRVRRDKSRLYGFFNPCNTPSTLPFTSISGNSNAWPVIIS